MLNMQNMQQELLHGFVFFGFSGVQHLFLVVLSGFFAAVEARGAVGDVGVAAASGAAAAAGEPLLEPLGATAAAVEAAALTGASPAPPGAAAAASGAVAPLAESPAMIVTFCLQHVLG